MGWGAGRIPVHSRAMREEGPRWRVRAMGRLRRRQDGNVTPRKIKGGSFPWGKTPPGVYGEGCLWSGPAWGHRLCSSRLHVIPTTHADGAGGIPGPHRSGRGVPRTAGGKAGDQHIGRCRPLNVHALPPIGRVRATLVNHRGRKSPPNTAPPFIL